MEEQFHDFLVSKGYAEFTLSGRKSTVYSYCNRIKKVCEREGLTWRQLADNIEALLPKYDAGGAEEDYGLKSNRTAINALRAYAEFVEQL